MTDQLSSPPCFGETARQNTGANAQFLNFLTKGQAVSVQSY